MSSNTVSLTRRSSRTEKLLCTAVDPITFSMPDDCQEAISEAIVMLEKGESSPVRLPELVAANHRLALHLRKSAESLSEACQQVIFETALFLEQEDNGPLEIGQFNQMVYKLSAQLKLLGVPVPLSARDAFIEAAAVIEKGEETETRLPEMVAVIKKLASQLKKTGVRHGFNKKDMVVWLVLEVLDTDVGVEDMMDALRHRSTLDELVFSTDSDSMISLLRLGENGPAKLRYDQLQQQVLG